MRLIQAILSAIRELINPPRTTRALCADPPGRQSRKETLNNKSALLDRVISSSRVSRRDVGDESRWTRR